MKSRSTQKRGRLLIPWPVRENLVLRSHRGKARGKMHFTACLKAAYRPFQQQLLKSRRQASKQPKQTGKSQIYGTAAAPTDRVKTVDETIRSPKDAL